MKSVLQVLLQDLKDVVLAAMAIGPVRMAHVAKADPAMVIGLVLMVPAMVIASPKMGHLAKVVPKVKKSQPKSLLRMELSVGSFLPRLPRKMPIQLPKLPSTRAICRSMC
jgi:hypothetical protein